VIEGHSHESLQQQQRFVCPLRHFPAQLLMNGADAPQCAQDCNRRKHQHRPLPYHVWLKLERGPDDNRQGIRKTSEDGAVRQSCTAKPKTAYRRPPAEQLQRRASWPTPREFQSRRGLRRPKKLTAASRTKAQRDGASPSHHVKPHWVGTHSRDSDPPRQRLKTPTVAPHHRAQPGAKECQNKKCSADDQKARVAVGNAGVMRNAPTSASSVFPRGDAEGRWQRSP